MSVKRKNDEYYDDYGDVPYGPPRSLLGSIGQGISALFSLGGRGTMALLRQSWRFTRACAWLSWQATAWAWDKSWVLARAVWGWAWAATRFTFNWSLAITIFIFSFFMRWVFGHEMRRDMPEYDQYGNPIVAAIRQRVGRRYRRRGRLVIMAGLNLLFNIGLWVDALRFDEPWRVLPITIFLAIIMGIHVVNFFVTEAEDNAVEREMIGQRRELHNLEERQLRLSDDGEVIPMDFDWWEKRKAQFEEQTP